MKRYSIDYISNTIYGLQCILICELLPYRYPTKLETAILGGISRSICM